MHDCFKQFLDLHAQGELGAAVRQILPSPDHSYHALYSDEKTLPFLANYIDAALFKAWTKRSMPI